MFPNLWSKTLADYFTPMCPLQMMVLVAVGSTSAHLCLGRQSEASLMRTRLFAEHANNLAGGVT